MRTGLRLALCQINPTVGDLTGNSKLIAEGIDAAKRAGADLVLFPELALTGYPPEDLLLREHFLTDTRTALAELARATEGIVAIVGFPERIPGAVRGPAPGSPGPVATVVHNSAAVLAGGTIEDVYRKVHLPNYGVFDEQRYFKAGEPSGTVIDVAGVKVGVTVCEDLWVAGPPSAAEAASGATLIVNVSASPYHAGKGLERERLFGERARETGAHVAFCAMVGGQDELVFDGHSFVLDQKGQTIARAAQFEEDLLVCDVVLSAKDMASSDGGMELSDKDVASSDKDVASSDKDVASSDKDVASSDKDVASSDKGDSRARASQHVSTVTHPVTSSEEQVASAGTAGAPLRAAMSSMEEEVYGALVLGLRDYVEKNGFGAVVLGLSGGIDSALVACLAVDALGAERVNVAIMPSPYSSSATQEDARALARVLEVRAHELEIAPAMTAYAATLERDFEGLHEDLTEENLQARIRGNLLMALSNKFGWLVLATGNKSEMSVGYTTLYGDLAGGFAVIKDVPKTLVYRLALWRNSPEATTGEGTMSGRAATPIPASILERPPSAELRADQTDQDSLPPYEVLDRILLGYIELDRSREQLIDEGLPVEDVERATRLVDRAEYKRRQAPPGIKITERAFGRDRRMPITNAYRG